MSSLSQASRLADLPSAHDAFQGHATHIIEWPTMLRPKDSEGTCIPSGVPTFLQTASRRNPSLNQFFSKVHRHSGVDISGERSAAKIVHRRTANDSTSYIAPLPQGWCMGERGWVRWCCGDENALPCQRDKEGRQSSSVSLPAAPAMVMMSPVPI